MPEFYVLLTVLGQAALATAQATGVPVQLSEMAVGDGLNGEYYDPDGSETALENEVWRGDINNLTVDPEIPNRILVELVIPVEEGNFWVREVGIFTAAGELFAIGKFPVTYKPQLFNGVAKELSIRLLLDVVDAANAQLAINPSEVLATREYVLSSIMARSAWADVQTFTQSTVLDSTDCIYRGDTSEGALDWTAPPATGNKGRQLYVENIGASGNDLTLNAAVGENIEGEDGILLSDGIGMKFYSNGFNWYRLKI